ncbi:MAG: hypothetical protein IJ452_01310 [Butyricicoccus sp.]|nr:hypothetical protein [Butyricicoccus sp.]MBQ8584905.1 hypothetical protein [Butyricicoccus sp.]
MSVIQCPQCARSAAASDESCPHCGYILQVRTASGTYLSSIARACPYCHSGNIRKASRYSNEYYREKYGLLGRIFGERAWKCSDCGRKFD